MIFADHGKGTARRRPGIGMHPASGASTDKPDAVNQANTSCISFACGTTCRNPIDFASQAAPLSHCSTAHFTSRIRWMQSLCPLMRAQRATIRSDQKIVTPKIAWTCYVMTGSGCLKPEFVDGQYFQSRINQLRRPVDRARREKKQIRDKREYTGRSCHGE